MDLKKTRAGRNGDILSRDIKNKRGRGNLAAQATQSARTIDPKIDENGDKKRCRQTKNRRDRAPPPRRTHTHIYMYVCILDEVQLYCTASRNLCSMQRTQCRDEILLRESTVSYRSRFSSISSFCPKHNTMDVQAPLYPPSPLFPALQGVLGGENVESKRKWERSYDTLYNAEKILDLLGDRCWRQTANQEGNNIWRRFL